MTTIKKQQAELEGKFQRKKEGLDDNDSKVIQEVVEKEEKKKKKFSRFAKLMAKKRKEKKAAQKKDSQGKFGNFLMKKMPKRNELRQGSFLFKLSSVISTMSNDMQGSMAKKYLSESMTKKQKAAELLKNRKIEKIKQSEKTHKQQ